MTSLTDFILSRKPSYFNLPVETKHYVKGRSFSIKKTVPVVIPPLNTVTDLSSIPAYKPTSQGLRDLGRKTIPNFFSWTLPEYGYISKDPEELKYKLKKIRENLILPPNQSACGSCWAISTAGAVGDCFVVSGIVEKNPNLSTTYLMSCMEENGNNAKCGGGFPAYAAKYIEEFGISTNECLSYNWCIDENNKNDETGSCVGNGDKTNLNDSIPSCGCECPNKKYNLYKIKNSETLIINDADNKDEAEIKIKLIKNAIMNNGPVIGAFLVPQTFSFSTVNDGTKNTTVGYGTQASLEIAEGIYMCDIDYVNSTPEQTVFVKGDNKVLGGHAIGVVGWGHSANKVSTILGKRIVHYWVCRNSWGTEWGNKGYFKMAFGTWNELGSIETSNARFNTNGIAMNGILCMNVSNKPIKQKFLETNKKYGDENLCSNTDPKHEDPKHEEPKHEEPIPDPEPEEPIPDPEPDNTQEETDYEKEKERRKNYRNKKKLYKFLIFVGVILFIIFFVLLINNMNKNKKNEYL